MKNFIMASIPLRDWTLKEITDYVRQLCSAGKVISTAIYFQGNVGTLVNLVAREYGSGVIAKGWGVFRYDPNPDPLKIA